MADIMHRIGIKAPVGAVYEALATVAGVAGWWTRETSGEARVGGTIEVRFRDHGASEDKGRMELEVVALRPGQEVRWRVKAGPAEWIGTEVSFALRQEGAHTIVVFGHRGWREPVEFMGHCSTKWATFLLSLRELVETGRGKPAPDDLKIDDWN